MFADNNTDFHDGGHLNVYGAEKATRYIGKYLLEHDNLNTNHSAAVCAKHRETGGAVAGAPPIGVDFGV